MMNAIVKPMIRLVPWGLRERVRRVPGFRILQRWLVSAALDGKPFVHRVDSGPAAGIAFLIELPADKGIWTGTYERGFASALGSVIKPHFIAYDIGSWHGFFTGVMISSGAREVHVFEPLPDNADRIKRLIALNPSSNVKLHGCAVADREADMDLLVMPQTSMAKLEISSFQPDCTSELKVRVPVRTIDAMVASGEIPPPDLIKIDVEGAEEHVLRGARHTIRSKHPDIFLEAHSPDLFSACMTLLSAEGYRTEDIQMDGATEPATEVRQVRAFYAGREGNAEPARNA